MCAATRKPGRPAGQLADSRYAASGELAAAELLRVGDQGPLGQEQVHAASDQHERRLAVLAQVAGQAAYEGHGRVLGDADGVREQLAPPALGRRSPARRSPRPGSTPTRPGRARGAPCVRSSRCRRSERRCTRSGTAPRRRPPQPRRSRRRGCPSRRWDRRRPGRSAAASGRRRPCRSRRAGGPAAPLVRRGASCPPRRGRPGRSPGRAQASLCRLGPRGDEPRVGSASAFPAHGSG